MVDHVQASDFEPTSWLVIFHRRCGTEWVNRLPGRFKHVSAIGWVNGANCWVYYDPTIHRTQVMVLPDEIGIATYARIAAPNAVLKVPVRERIGAGRVGFWCVPAIKHLLGLRSGALLPDRLWKDCLANGGEIVSDDARHSSTQQPADAGRNCGG